MLLLYGSSNNLFHKVSRKSTFSEKKISRNTISKFINIPNFFKCVYFISPFMILRWIPKDYNLSEKIIKNQELQKLLLEENKRIKKENQEIIEEDKKEEGIILANQHQNKREFLKEIDQAMNPVHVLNNRRLNVLQNLNNCMKTEQAMRENRRNQQKQPRKFVDNNLTKRADISIKKYKYNEQKIISNIARYKNQLEQEYKNEIIKANEIFQASDPFKECKENIQTFNKNYLSSLYPPNMPSFSQQLLNTDIPSIKFTDVGTQNNNTSFICIKSDFMQVIDEHIFHAIWDNATEFESPITIDKIAYLNDLGISSNISESQEILLLKSWFAKWNEEGFSTVNKTATKYKVFTYIIDNRAQKDSIIREQNPKSKIAKNYMYGEKTTTFIDPFINKEPFSSPLAQRIQNQKLNIYALLKIIHIAITCILNINQYIKHNRCKSISTLVFIKEFNNRISFIEKIFMKQFESILQQYPEINNYLKEVLNCFNKYIQYLKDIMSIREDIYNTQETTLYNNGLFTKLQSSYIFHLKLAEQIEEELNKSYHL